MIDRYNDRQIKTNSLDVYKKIFEERNVKYINQYTSPSMKVLTDDELKNISVIDHIWKTGDRFYKLAAIHYGDPRDWWVIAKFNNIPTEFHVKVGDIVSIPFPLQQFIRYMRGT